MVSNSFCQEQGASLFFDILLIFTINIAMMEGYD